MTFTAAPDTLYRTWAENQEQKIAVRVQFAIEITSLDGNVITLHEAQSAL